MRRSPLVALLVVLALVVAAVAVAQEGDPPTLTAPQAVGISERTADLSAIADTDGLGGTLSVRYGRSAATPTATVTLVRIPHATKAGRAGGSVMDLAPGTTYHYRLILTTLTGTAATPDATFTTAGRVAATSARCRVPRLTGRLWPVAHRALRRANCRTGNVRRPVRTARPMTLVVVSQTIAAGRVRPAGTRVGVRLKVRR